MTFKPARLLLALIAIAASFANLPASAQNLAVVNGKAIPSSRADQAVKQVVAQGQGQDSPQLREAVKQQLIAREVMMQEAVKQGYDKNPEVKQALESARQTIVINALARDYITKHPVTDAEVKAEYDRFVKTSGDKEYHVRHILLDNEADANAVIAKIKGGAKFEDLAKQSKDTGSANNGGDLDWASPSSFPPEFAAGLTGLQKGQVTEKPVKTQVGYHVIKLDDIRQAKLPTLDEVKPQIQDSLSQQKLAAFQEEMVKKAKVQ
ncbi:peptidyl-prolyl cis-trans isomerase [Herbaspirillum sp. SJZ107]|uniref:peptidylprolyl isomerase n=1 Tax=Herbaspirillum sp. SJZ107 TaxID=2572881 RepID=UPI00114FFB64|nr:peptidyl-prolyl cis-trans isomerase [Herbaspirillum sp. SJZ107]TQK11485.1 peptidyl-prolyl cis-trans isomerase C [Herbaspirillum sp. SJZ107]